VLEEARHISHRNFGLFNLSQIELLDELSAVYDQAGDTRQAQREQLEILNVAQRHFGTGNAGVIPYHYKLAGYYELARMHGRARDEFERALEIVRSNPASGPGDELEPLTELVRIDARTGETSRARRELEERLHVTADVDAATRAEAYAVLGDFELANGRIDTATDFYGQAYASFADAYAADAYFRAPRLIDFVPPPTAVDFGRRRNAPYAWGSITARFGVTATGKAERIAIVVSDPPGLMDARYARRLAEAVFRPRLAAGQPVATSRLRFSHEFRYFLPEED
jgi:tetratricopeptide (TPR) repeat protein